MSTAKERYLKDYEAFLKQKMNISTEDVTRYALYRDEEDLGHFDTRRDAELAGQLLFSDRRFSVIGIDDKIIVGGFSLASDQRAV